MACGAPAAVLDACPQGPADPPAGTATQGPPSSPCPPCLPPAPPPTRLCGSLRGDSGTWKLTVLPELRADRRTGGWRRRRGRLGAGGLSLSRPPARPQGAGVRFPQLQGRPVCTQQRGRPWDSGLSPCRVPRRGPDQQGDGALSPFPPNNDTRAWAVRVRCPLRCAHAPSPRPGGTGVRWACPGNRESGREPSVEGPGVEGADVPGRWEPRQG